MANTKLWDIVNELKGPGYKWVNLTHELSPQTPHWFGFSPLEGELLFDYLEGTPDDKMAPMRCHQWSVASQYGTHTDAPIHFHADGRDLSEITEKELMMPLVVIDPQQLQVVARPNSLEDLQTGGPALSVNVYWCLHETAPFKRGSDPIKNFLKIKR